MSDEDKDGVSVDGDWTGTKRGHGREEKARVNKDQNEKGNINRGEPDGLYRKVVPAVIGNSPYY